MSYDEMYTLMLFGLALGFGGALLWRRRQLKKLRAEALELQAQGRALRHGVNALEQGLGHMLAPSVYKPCERKWGHTYPVAPVPEPVRAEESTVPLWRRPECQHAGKQAVVFMEVDKTTGLLNAGLRCAECKAWIMRSCNQCGEPQSHVNALNLCEGCAHPRGF